jgi:hypothetical protein
MHIQYYYIGERCTVVARERVKTLQNKLSNELKPPPPRRNESTSALWPRNVVILLLLLLLLSLLYIHLCDFS